jgi:pyrroline-5-carboxylate reductase
LVEVLSEIGKKEGLSEESAKVLALETLIGSARLLETSNIDPKNLRQNVTSPGGTTEAGLEILASKKTGLFDLFNSTINSAKQRAIYLNSNN